MPLAGVGMKPMMARRAVRMLHEGCQVSGWWPEMLRQIFLLVSKRPFGCKERVSESKDIRALRAFY